MSTERSDFEQGHAAGLQDQSIADHGRRLDTINGSIADTATVLGEVKAEVRSLREEEKRRSSEVVRRARNFRWWVTIGLGLLTLVSALRGSPLG